MLLVMLLVVLMPFLSLVPTGGGHTLLIHEENDAGIRK